MATAATKQSIEYKTPVQIEEDSVDANMIHNSRMARVFSRSSQREIERPPTHCVNINNMQDERNWPIAQDVNGHSWLAVLQIKI